MKAVLLAAGKSTRTYPITLTRPKPLVKIANKTLLEHNLEQLEGIVDEVIIVVGYKKEMIMERFKDEFAGMKLTYVEQKEQLGSGHAFSCAKDSVKGKFIAMNGDDLYSKKDIQNCIKHDSCVLGKEVNDPEKWGIFVVEKNLLKQVIEKPKQSPSNLANTGLYIIDSSIFDITPKKSERGEFEFTDMLSEYAKKNKVSIEKVIDYWIPVGYPWHIIEANEFFVNKLTKSDIKGDVEQNVTIKGNLVVGKGTIVRSGTYIEGNVLIGENCKIGPNCYIRGSTSIGNNCHIGQAVELKNSVILDNTNVPHLNYVGDSVIGEKSNLGAGTIVANLRHDNANVKSSVKGILIDTGRRKLGTIIADNVHTGINTSIYPGRKIWPNLSTLPGEVVKKDKE